MSYSWNEGPFDYPNIEHQLCDFELSVTTTFRDFSIADGLMPNSYAAQSGDAGNIKQLQPPISFDEPHKARVSHHEAKLSISSSTSTASSLPESVISQRKSSLSRIRTAPVNIQKTPNSVILRSGCSSGMIGTPRGPDLPTRVFKFSPVTPTGEFTPRNLVIQRANSDSLDQMYVPETPRSGKLFGSRASKSTDKSMDSVTSLASLPSISAPPLDVHDESRISERMRQRQNIARELFFTECQFAQDMAVVVRIFMCGSANVGLSVRQIDTLFSNVTHVMDLSLSIAAILKAHIPPQLLQEKDVSSFPDISADKELMVGKAMCNALTGQFYEVYETYIHHNSEQMELCYNLTKLFGKLSSAKTAEQSESAVRKELANIDGTKLDTWLQHSIRRAKRFTTAWSLDSLLIKPTQRIGKYPLFLKAILNCTDPEHEDYENIQKAFKRAVQYMDCVNARFEAERENQMDRAAQTP